MPVMTTRRRMFAKLLACLGVLADVVDGIVTVRIFSASSSGISISKASSKAMTSSTVSSESAPRSSTNEALGVTSPSSTPNCSTIICFTFSSTAAIVLLVSESWSRGPGIRATFLIYDCVCSSINEVETSSLKGIGKVCKGSKVKRILLVLVCVEITTES